MHMINYGCLHFPESKVLPIKGSSKCVVEYTCCILDCDLLCLGIYFCLLALSD